MPPSFAFNTLASSWRVTPEGFTKTVENLASFVFAR